MQINLSLTYNSIPDLVEITLHINPLSTEEEIILQPWKQPCQCQCHNLQFLLKVLLCQRFLFSCWKILQIFDLEASSRGMNIPCDKINETCDHDCVHLDP